MAQRGFYDAVQASSYLSSSVVLRNGRPIRIENLANAGDGEYKVAYRYLAEPDGPAMFSFLKRDDSIDFTPFRMGMCMYRAKSRKRVKSFYLTRKPRRMWKVGLTVDSLGVRSIHGQEPNYILPPTSRVMWSQYFEDMVTGNYPSYPEAMQLLKAGKDNEIAISNRFAIFQGGLYYKALGVPVGTATVSGIELLPNFQYLREVLREDMPDVNQ